MMMNNLRLRILKIMVLACIVMPSISCADVATSTKLHTENECHNDAKLNRNKENVIRFYELLFNQNKPRLAVEKYVGDEYIQHNSHVADGKEALIAHFEQRSKQYPKKHADIVKIIAEKDYVVIFCHQIWPGDKQPEWAAINIFRLDKKGKIVEHWDTVQAVPPNSKNSNTMF